MKKTTTGIMFWQWFTYPIVTVGTFLIVAVIMEDEPRVLTHFFSLWSFGVFGFWCCWFALGLETPSRRLP